MSIQDNNSNPTTPEQLARREVRLKALAHELTVMLFSDLAKKAKTKRTSKTKNKHKEV